MSLVSTNVPSLVNGVSQQAENLRFTSQCEEQINGFSSVLRGLLKRPPTKHVEKINGLPAGKLKVHPINRSVSERFMLAMGSEYMHVTTLAGLGITVFDQSLNPVLTTPGALAYLSTPTPETSLKALTVADYTIIVNTDRTVAKLSTVTPVLDPSALIFTKLFRTDTDYTIRLFDDPTSTTADYTFTFTTATATDNQETITAGLRALINADVGANATYNHFHEGPLLYLNKQDGSDFRVEVACDIPEGLAAFKDVAQNFSSLPKKGWVGFQLKIKGDPETEGDDYYVKFVGQDANASGFSEGTWEESQKFGLQDQLDPLTMPHALRSSGNFFVFGPLEWVTRICGDETTNPGPSFIGKTIRDVFFFKNRLGFLADENVVMSEASEFFNFWRTTVIQVLDSDPIDVGTSHIRSSLLNTALPSNEQLVLFSEQTQFVLKGGDLLTPKSVSITPASEYENISTVPPKMLGDSVVFPFLRGDYSGIYDYSIEPETGLFKGTDVTEHVPVYLQGSVEMFDVSSLSNLIAVKTDAFSDTLFIYQFFKRGRDRLQSAWHRWQFSGTIRSFFIIGSTLYLLIQRGGETFFESINLDAGAKDASSAFTTLLDRRITDAYVVRVYDEDLDETTFTLPYSPTAGMARATIRSTSGVQGGASVYLTSQSGTTLKAAGNWTATPLWFGESYTMEMTLTRPQLREQRNDGSFVVMPGRFQVKRGFLSHNDSLAFTVLVMPKGRGTYTYVYSPRELGTLTTIIGSPPTQQDGVFPFTVLSKNDQVTIKLVNDTALPCALLSIDWEALYTLRAQRT